MKTPRKTLWRDVAIGITMFVFAFFALLNALSHHFPVILTVLYVLAIGSLPWPIYNVIAHFAGWQKSSVSELAGYWIDLLLSTWP